MKKPRSIGTSILACFARALTHLYTGRAWLGAALIAVLNLVPAGRVTAQTFTTLYGLDGLANGGYPNGLIVSSNTVYGTTASGGNGNSGTLFAMNTDGTGFTNLHGFTPSYTPIFYIPATNSDGAYPKGLIVSGNTLYGAAGGGGSGGSGTVFAMNTDGTGFTNLYTFTFTFAGFDFINSDGDGLNSLILSGQTLYGTANRGGSSGNGTVFAINTDGSGFTNLHSFTALDPTYYTNSEGANPRAGLILSGNTLYGTANSGGSSGHGTVFAINRDGTGLTNLHSFTAYSGAYPETNSDGFGPVAGLVLSGNTLYGTAYWGGNSGNGTVFAVNTNGTGFTNLHSFTALSGPNIPPTNSDGAYPEAGLILSGNTLYGTTFSGGSSDYGTVFAINTDGTGFTNLHNFTRNGDGANPTAGLVLSGNTLYGVAYPDSLHSGTVFSLSFRPQLTIAPAGTPPSGIILTWPTNVAGFDYTGYILQSAPALTGTFTNLPAATNPYTNPICGAQKFYRLVR